MKVVIFLRITPLGAFSLCPNSDLVVQGKTWISARFFLDALRCYVSTSPRFLSVSEDLGWHTVVVVTDLFPDPSSA